MKIETKFDFGDRVTDIICGFSGWVTAVSIYLNGCVQYAVQPRISVDSKEYPKEK